MSGSLDRIARRRRAAALRRVAQELSHLGRGNPEPPVPTGAAASPATMPTPEPADEVPPAAPATVPVGAEVTAERPSPVAAPAPEWFTPSDPAPEAAPPSAEVGLAADDPADEPAFVDLPDTWSEPLAEAPTQSFTAVAAPEPEPGPPAESPERPGRRERARMVRRARYLRALRELQLRDLGGFLLELHRLGGDRPELVRAKLEGAALVDSELRALEHALSIKQRIGEVRAPGIGGACAHCGAVHGSSDRFCANCGEALGADLASAEELAGVPGAPRLIADEA